MRTTWLCMVGLLASSMVACSKDAGGMAEPKEGSTEGAGVGDGGVGGSSAAVTFHRDVRTLLEQHCSGCHREGGIGPMVLGYDASEWKGGAPSWAPAAVAAVEARAMPPWMPDPSCRELAHSRRLSDADVEVFTTWRESGFAQGDEADYVPPTVESMDLGEPTLTLAPAEAYTPSTQREDDYRCFLLPHVFDQESYLTATQVEPGASGEVHHVILFAIDEGSLGEAEALDAADEGPGYTCYGGPGVAGASNVGGWVPGTVPSIAPEDSARVLRAGTRIVMQIHYNTGHVHAGEMPSADRTRAKLWLMKSGEKPTYKITTVPLAHLGISIPAGESESVQVKGFDVPFEGTLTGVLPHMHTLGKRVEVTHTRAGEESCLVRIPDWDFHWQQGYRFTEDAYLELKAGDKLELTCVYDNGEGTETVRWGEGTSDEMCLNYLEIRTPFAGATLEQDCPSYTGCVDACADGDAACLLQCSAATPGCRACVPTALGRCASGHCPDEAVAVQSCLFDCNREPSCVRTECLDAYTAFTTCMEPYVRDGSCDALLATCGT